MEKARRFRLAFRFMWRPRRDSNARARFRRAALYPLSYGGVPQLYRYEKP